MVMGLCNSAQTWQRLLMKVLSDMVFESAIVYLDILLIGRDFPEHYNNLEKLFQRFRDANLRMNGKKCSFAKTEVKYIGHILSKDGIRIDPSKADAISEWTRPKSHKHVKSFFGMANYYKRFIHRYFQHYIALQYKLFYSGQSKKTARSTMAQVTQQCQDMTAEISVSSVFDEMTTAMLQ